MIFIAQLVMACGAPSRDEPCFESAAWAEADQLFLGDPHWVGADGAYSIDLGNDRTLWLFGDTWIDPAGHHSRKDAHMIRNSIAVQKGADPSTASISFYPQMAADETPRAFFARDDEQWYWPGHGIRLDDRLILFLSRLRATSAGLGFESAGWNAVMIENPDDEPSVWRSKLLPTPANSRGITVGFAGTLRWEEYLYAFGAADAVPSHPVYVARWPLATLRAGDLSAPQWWAGPEIGWAADTPDTPPVPVLDNGQSELTIHFDAYTRQFIEIQTTDFGKSDLAMRVASYFTGPWTTPRAFYRPAEYARPNVMIYSAKAHPQLSGADLVATYSNNTFEFAEHLTDSSIYYPRFVRMQRCGAKD